MDTEDLFEELRDYYGEYRRDAQKRITEAFIKKRVKEEQYPHLLRFIYENHHANHGPPSVSAIKKILLDAAKNENFHFTRPFEGNRGTPLYKCEKCGKLFPMSGLECDYCKHKLLGSGTIVVPKTYFY